MNENRRLRKFHENLSISFHCSFFYYLKYNKSEINKARLLNEMNTLFKWLPHPDYANKLSFSDRLRHFIGDRSQFFYQPGKIYSSGITGIAQILTTVSTDWLWILYPRLSRPIVAEYSAFLFLGWFKIGHKFTIFTGITVVLTSCSYRFFQKKH